MMPVCLMHVDSPTTKRRSIEMQSLKIFSRFANCILAIRIKCDILVENVNTNERWMEIKFHSHSLILGVLWILISLYWITTIEIMDMYMERFFLMREPANDKIQVLDCTKFIWLIYEYDLCGLNVETVRVKFVQTNQFIFYHLNLFLLLAHYITNTFIIDLKWLDD